jgi:hypothetical protein
MKGQEDRDLAPELLDEATLFASPLPIVGERKTTTRKEIWVGFAFVYRADGQSWYLYYVGNSGLGTSCSKILSS